MATRHYAFALAAGTFLMGALGLAAAPAQAPQSAVTFQKDVLPILQKNCQTCHRPGQIGPFSMLTYKETRPWAKAIKNAVVTKAMPPWLADPQYGHFDNDRSLKPADMATIVAWADSGAVEGDPKDAPPPLNWPPAGWQSQPDVVVDLPTYNVPAVGVVDWQNFAVPAPFKEDTWVTSIQVLPGDTAVVHHMCFGFEQHKPTTMYNTYEWVEIPRDDEGLPRNRPQPVAGAAPVEGATGEGGTTPREGTVVTREASSTVEKRRQGRPALSTNGTFCYLPGLPIEDYRPMGAGYLVPAGSDIIVSIHYTSNGLAVVDKTRIGFTVARTPPAREFLPQGGERVIPGRTSPVQQKSRINEMAIPPREGAYVAPPIEVTFLKDTELVSLRPHAHVRGKSVQYKLTYPDGREEIVLNVPRYDFNWQLTYRTSVKVPQGSKMQIQFVYDNSATNRYNPDPSKWVYNGQQSWEEMGVPFLGFLVDREPAK